MAEEGYSQRQIADAVGVHRSTVQDDLGGGNPPVEEAEQAQDDAWSGGNPPSTAAEALQAAKEIKNHRRQIADAVGVSHTTIGDDLSGNNLPVDEEEDAREVGDGGSYLPSTAADVLQAAKEIKSHRRQIADAVGVDEKTVRRHSGAANAADEEDGQAQSSDDDAANAAFVPSTAADVLQAAKESAPRARGRGFRLRLENGRSQGRPTRSASPHPSAFIGVEVVEHGAGFAFRCRFVSGRTHGISHGRRVYLAVRVAVITVTVPHSLSVEMLPHPALSLRNGYICTQSLYGLSGANMLVRVVASPPPPLPAIRLEGGVRLAVETAAGAVPWRTRSRSSGGRLESMARASRSVAGVVPTGTKASAGRPTRARARNSSCSGEQGLSRPPHAREGASLAFGIENGRSQSVRHMGGVTYERAKRVVEAAGDAESSAEVREAAQAKASRGFWRRLFGTAS